MSTEREMLNLLNIRYGQVYGNGPRWTRAEHVKNRLGHESRRICDYMAVHLWPGNRQGRDHIIIGHEVKCSRADWLTELRDPEKAEAFRPYVHQWYLVASDRSIVKPGELPEGWGLMVPSGSSLRAVIAAPKVETPEPMPFTMTAALLRATAKTAARLAGPGAHTIVNPTLDPLTWKADA